jgi:hypothetical protein
VGNFWLDACEPDLSPEAAARAVYAAGPAAEAVDRPHSRHDVPAPVKVLAIRGLHPSGDESWHGNPAPTTVEDTPGGRPRQVRALVDPDAGGDVHLLLGCLVPVVLLELLTECYFYPWNVGI